MMKRKIGEYELYLVNSNRSTVCIHVLSSNSQSVGVASFDLQSTNDFRDEDPESGHSKHSVPRLKLSRLPILIKLSDRRL